MFGRELPLPRLRLETRLACLRLRQRELFYGKSWDPVTDVARALRHILKTLSLHRRSCVKEAPNKWFKQTVLPPLRSGGRAA